MSTPTAQDPVRAPLDPSRTVWREYTNSNGKKYRVGYGIPVHEDLEKAKETIAGFKGPNSPEGIAHREAKKLLTPGSSKEVTVNVNWPYCNDGVWKIPDDAVKDHIGIDAYQLGWNSGGWYNYKLSIRCSECWDYTFYNTDGDYYTLAVDCTCWDHDVCFDTKDNVEPTINKIVADQ
ncbi:hypothetical protein BJ165DRAFT_1527274 [Panaeolus papilionaceus]|nr:hypothetical protein BJ165DRAFT_1527274 [Panaeolus papilionaceus]